MEAIIEGTKEPPIQSTIYGKDSDGHPITLMRCMCSRMAANELRDEYEIVAPLCIRGQEVESLDDPVAKSVSFSLDKFHRWLGEDFIKLHQAEGDRLNWIIPPTLELKYPLGDNGVFLRITQTTLVSHSWDEVEFKPGCQLWLTFNTPCSLGDIIREWVPCIVRFFSLLHGDRFEWDSVGYASYNPFVLGELSQAEGVESLKEGRITIRSNFAERNRGGDIPGPWMVAPFSAIKEHLPQMLARWYEVHQRLKPAIELFWAVAFRASNYLEASFLFLVQALEVYHARSSQFDSAQLPPDEHRRRVQAVFENAPPELKEWLKRKIQSQNYKYLDERLTDIFSAYLLESRELFEDVEGMAKRISFTRNYLTHYPNRTDSSRLIDERDMIWVNDALERLLWIIFLRELGLPEPIINGAWKSLVDLRAVKKQ